MTNSPIFTTFPIFNRYHSEVLHFSSTRHGGVSTKSNTSLNLGFHDNDTVENVVKNRALLAQSAGFTPLALTVADQVHGCNITVVTQEMKGRGATEKPSSIPNSDALICAVPNVCVAVKTADCTPILLYAPDKKVVAAIHAGWRGTVQQIVRLTAEKMQREFGCQPQYMVAAIGCNIGKCCYEVGEEVVSNVQQNFGSTNGFIHYSPTTGRPHFDMQQANRHQLLAIGLNPANIGLVNTCTHCNNKDYFSHRRGDSGRLMTGIMIKG